MIYVAHEKACYTPIGMAKLKQKQQISDNIKSWQIHRRTGTFIHCWLQCKKSVASHFKKQFGNFFLELNIHLLWDLAISLPGTCPEKMKKYIHTQVYTKKHYAQMLIAVLFIITQIWKQPNVPQLMNGWIHGDIAIQWNTTQH